MTTVINLNDNVVVPVPDRRPVINVIAAPGPRGPSGGEVTSYVHLQAVPDTTWTIPHMLGYYPNVSVFELGTDDQIEGFEVNHIDIDHMTITFAIPLAGEADLS